MQSTPPSGRRAEGPFFAARTSVSWRCGVSPIARSADARRSVGWRVRVVLNHFVDFVVRNGLELQRVERVVKAALREQFFVRAEFLDAPVVQHQHAVGLLNRLQTMRDQDRRACGRELAQRILNQQFGFGVDTRGRFVENQNFRV